MVPTSLPTRERGLKYYELIIISGGLLSLPTRERGLKLTYPPQSAAAASSLPTRERGLKYADRVILRGLVGRSLHGSVD